MKCGFVYLVAILDWATRKVLAHRVSTSMTPDFCVDALEEAIAQYGTPDIFNTDQGSQFASVDFTQVLKGHGITISMDGKGRWVDNVFVERLWKSAKYEHVYLHAYDSVSEAKQQLAGYLEFYNTRRPHSSLGGQTPDTAYFGNGERKQAA
jgi:putative transposase